MRDRTFRLATVFAPALAVALSLSVIAVPSTAPRAQEEPPLTLAGEYVFSHYLMHVLNTSPCGPVEGGPFGPERGLKAVAPYLTDAELASLTAEFRSNDAQYRTMAQGLFEENYALTLEYANGDEAEACANARMDTKFLFDFWLEELRQARGR